MPDLDSWETVSYVYAVEWESKKACKAHAKESYNVSLDIPGHQKVSEEQLKWLHRD